MPSQSFPAAIGIDSEVRVSKKHIHQPCLHLTGANHFRHLIGDLVGAFAFGGDDEFGAIDGDHNAIRRTTSLACERP